MSITWFTVGIVTTGLAGFAIGMLVNRKWAWDGSWGWFKQPQNLVPILIALIGAAVPLALQYREVGRLERTLNILHSINCSAITDGEVIRKSITDPQTRGKIEVLRAYSTSLFDVIIATKGLTKREALNELEQLGYGSVYREEELQ